MTFVHFIESAARQGMHSRKGKALNVNKKNAVVNNWNAKRFFRVVMVSSVSSISLNYSLFWFYAMTMIINGTETA